MLPKDILQYARRFSPREIEQAIKDTITGQKHVSDFVNLTLMQQMQQMQQLGISSTTSSWINSVGTTTSPGNFIPTNVTYSY